MVPGRRQNRLQVALKIKDNIMVPDTIEKSEENMLRDIDENLIKPEKLMSSSDMAKLGCNECRGCSSCCRDRAEAITLDQWDVMCIKKGLGLTFGQLLDKELLVLTIIDGVLLPTLGKKKTADECIFLGEDGRCGIHDFRPGICRMFPLARLYHEDGSFSYFMQEGECEQNNGVKIKISKWLGIPNIAAYENMVRNYHARLKNLRVLCAAATSREEIVALQKNFIEDNFDGNDYT